MLSLCQEGLGDSNRRYFVLEIGHDTPVVKLHEALPGASAQDMSCWKLKEVLRLCLFPHKEVLSTASRQG